MIAVSTHRLLTSILIRRYRYHPYASVNRDFISPSPSDKLSRGKHIFPATPICGISDGYFRLRHGGTANPSPSEYKGQSGQNPSRPWGAASITTPPLIAFSFLHRHLTSIVSGAGGGLPGRQPPSPHPSPFGPMSLCTPVPLCFAGAHAARTPLFQG